MFFRFLINKKGKSNIPIQVINQIIIHESEHSIPILVINIWVPNNRIAVNPGIKNPTTQKIKVDFKKLYFNISQVY